MARRNESRRDIIINVDGTQEIDRLTKLLEEADEKVDQLEQELEEARLKAQQFEDTIANMKFNSGVDVLEKELERFRETAKESAREFAVFLKSVNLMDAEGNHDAAFSELFDKIREGSISAQQAIAKVKTEFAHLMEDNFLKTDGAFDSRMIQSFQDTILKLGETMDTVLQKLDHIENYGVKGSGGGGGGGTAASLEELSRLFDRLIQSSQTMSETASESVNSISNLVSSIGRLGKEVDTHDLLAVSQAFRNIADIGTGTFSTKSIDNLMVLMEKIRKLNESGTSRLRFDLSGLRDFKASSTIKHLIDLIDQITDEKIGRLERLSRVDLSKFDQNNLKISKSTADHLKTMLEVEEAQKKEAEAYQKTSDAAVEHKKDVEAAAKAEEDKAKISALLAEALKREEATSRSSGRAANKHAEDVSRMLKIQSDIGRLGSLRDTLKIEDPKRFEEVTRQLELLGKEYSALHVKNAGLFSDSEIRKLSQAEVDATNRIRLAQSAATDSVMKLNAAQAAALRNSAEKAAAARAESNEVMRQKAEQEQLNKTFTEAITKLKELGKAREERKESSGNKTSEEYQRANEKVKEFYESYRKLRSELGSNISVAQQEAITKELQRQANAVKDLNAGMSDSAHRSAEAAKAAATTAQANAQLKNTQAQQAAEVKDTNAQYKDLFETLQKIGKYRLDKQKALFSGKDDSFKEAEKQMQGMIDTYRRLRQELNGKLSTAQLHALSKEMADQKREFSKLLADQSSSTVLSDNKAFKDAIRQYDDAKQAADGLKYKTDEVTQAMSKLFNAMEQVRGTTAGTEERSTAMEHFNTVLKDTNELLRKQKTEQDQYLPTLKKINGLITQCESAQKKYATAAKLGIGREDYDKVRMGAHNLEELRRKLIETGRVTPEIAAKFRELSESISMSTTNLKTKGNLLGNWLTTGMQQLRSRMTYSLGLAAMVYKSVNEIKKMVSVSIELDTAMNQLQIVTRSTGAEMDVYAKRVSAMAKETGQATKDLIDATTVYARLGYSMDESATLSKYTAMLQGVGDIEASAAQDAMTAIIKAFGKDVDDVEDVMNKMVVVGNNFPISVAQIAEGMNNAGSMLAVASNSLDQSIALLTAANTTVQNISKASTGLRTIAARIRKTTTEEEDGEAINESKYEEMIGILTRYKVALTTINGEYRSTYDVIKDIAGVWGELTSMEKAAVTEALAGTRQQNVFSSLVTQFQEAEGALDSMKNSGGELEEAYNIYLNSIQAHVKTLKAAFDELSRDFVNGDLVKGAIDFLTKIVEILDWIVEHGPAAVAVLTGISAAIGTLKVGAAAGGIKSFSDLITAFGMFAGPAGVVIALLGSLAGALYLYKKLCIDAFKTTKQLADEFEDAKKEAESLQKQVDTNNERLKDLNKLKGTSDWTDELEAERLALEEENTKLQEQLDLLREIEQYKKDALVMEKNRELGFFFSKGQTVTEDTNTFLGSKTVRSTEGYGGVLNALEDYEQAKNRLDELEEQRRNHEWANEAEANALKSNIIQQKNAVAEYRTTLETFWNFLTDSKEILFDSDDEDSIENIVQINELLDEMAAVLKKDTKTVGNFRSDLLKLDKTVRDKLAAGLSLTDDEFRKFENWLKKCGYSIGDFESLLKDLSLEMHMDDPSAENYATSRITEWGTMADEIVRAKNALEEYKMAMKEGSNDDIAKGMQEAWKTAMEDLESGKIDSRAVWKFAEMVFSPEQLAAMRYRAENVASAIRSSFFREMFDDDNAENGFSDEDNKYAYGQRFLKYLETHQNELAGVNVWRNAAGGIQYTIKDFSELARQLDISEGLLDALLYSLDAYGAELMTDETQNTKLIKTLKQYTDTISDAREATKEFIRDTFEHDKNIDEGTMFRILDELHEQGHLQLDPSEYIDLIREAKALAKQAEDEDPTVKPRADDTLLAEDIDNMLSRYQAVLDRNPLYLRAKLDYTDPYGFGNTLNGTIDDLLEELGDKYNELINGNVDYNKRPYLTKEQMIAAGWRNFDQDVATTYTQGHTIGEGKFTIDITPILENGEVLSPDALLRYIKTLNTNGDINDLLASDENKLIVHVAPGEYDKQYWDSLEGKLSYIKDLHAELTAMAEDDAMAGAQAALDTGEFNDSAEDVMNWLIEIDNETATPSVGLDMTSFYAQIRNAYAALSALQNAANAANTAGSTASKAKTTASWVNVRAFADGGKTGKGGKVLVNELGPELISDKGKAFVANHGEPGFVTLSKDAIVFNAEETKRIAGNGHSGLIDRLISGKHTGAYASGSYWTCPFCGRSNPSSASRCQGCGKDPRTYKPTTTTSTASKVTTGVTTSTSKSALTSSTPGKTVATYWTCPDCRARNETSRDYCAVCHRYRYQSSNTSSKASSLVSKGYDYSSTLTSGKNLIFSPSSYGKVLTSNETPLFKLGGSDGGGGGGVGSAPSESRTNPQKVDWIAVKLNRIQRAVQDLEKVASSGLKKLSTRIDAAKSEASKLNEEIQTAEEGYNRYLQEAESVGLSSGLAELVKNGAINIEEYEDEELRQQIQEYQEWYEKALDCKSAVEDLNQQIGELYKTNFDLVQADYANQLSLIEHEMDMINKDISMAQAKGMIDSAAYYERLIEQQTLGVEKMKAELRDLEKYFNEAMNSGKIEEGSEEWYAMKTEINGVKEAIADANVQLQEYANTIRSINWSYFDYAQDQFSQLAQEANFLIELMSNDKLFQDNGQFTASGMATVGMHAIDFDAYMAQADEYAKEMRKINSELAEDPYNKDLIARRNTLLQLQQQSIIAAEQEKNAVKSLVQEGIQIELESLRDLINAYKEQLDAEKDLYEYSKKISEQTSDIASIQKQLAAYSNDTSEETRAKVQKLNKDLEKARTTLAETERDQSVSDQKKLLDAVYDEYEDLLNQRLDNIDLLMREMIDASNENAGTIRGEIANVAAKVGYTVSNELTTAMSSYANYDRVFESMSGATTVLNRIYENVNAMARAAGAVKAYAKGGLIDYTGLAAVHGSPVSPELVLSAADTERFLEAAQMMQTMQGLTPVSAKDLGLVMANGTEGGSIGDITMNIEIERVLDYNDFVTQLQADPKFEKLIDSMTMSRMLGGSKFAKNTVRF